MSNSNERVGDAMSRDATSLPPGSPDARVVAANIAYHTALAPEYDRTQPHFRPENVERLDRLLGELAQRTGGGSLLDLGCGTGFVMSIAKRHFRRVVGVDVTPAMLALVDRSDHQVEVFEAPTESLPFADGEFDVCTANSFLHHLFDLDPTLREARRCLRTGGLFFADQDPNSHFWAMAYALKDRADLTGIVAREVSSVVSAESDVAAEIGLDPDTVGLAEFQKMRNGGLDPDDTVARLLAAGFSHATYRYEWFLGQGKVLHQQGQGTAATVEQYLREALPASRGLFKYVSFHAEK